MTDDAAPTNADGWATRLLMVPTGLFGYGIAGGVLFCGGWYGAAGTTGAGTTGVASGRGVVTGAGTGAGTGSRVGEGMTGAGDSLYHQNALAHRSPTETDTCER